jgi:hypothetical protein
MSKKLAGKRWFYALGASHETRGVKAPSRFSIVTRGGKRAPMRHIIEHFGRSVDEESSSLPDWAIMHYWQGRFDQEPRNQRHITPKLTF